MSAGSERGGGLTRSTCAAWLHGEGGALAAAGSRLSKPGRWLFHESKGTRVTESGHATRQGPRQGTDGLSLSQRKDTDGTRQTLSDPAGPASLTSSPGAKFSWHRGHRLASFSGLAAEMVSARQDSVALWAVGEAGSQGAGGARGPARGALTVAVLGLDMRGQLLFGDSLAAAVAPPEPVPPVALRQQVLRQAGDLHHLQPKRRTKPAAAGTGAARACPPRQLAPPVPRAV